MTLDFTSHLPSRQKLERSRIHLTFPPSFYHWFRSWQKYLNRMNYTSLKACKKALRAVHHLERCQFREEFNHRLKDDESTSSMCRIRLGHERLWLSITSYPLCPLTVFLSAEALTPTFRPPFTQTHQIDGSLISSLSLTLNMLCAGKCCLSSILIYVFNKFLTLYGH